MSYKLNSHQSKRIVFMERQKMDLPANLFGLPVSTIYEYVINNQLKSAKRSTMIEVSLSVKIGSTP